ncbi:aminotransferase class I/II-fold pyridoxal phosphate-dependent enzyme [Streptomyces sp. TRM66268-LWL]|uniref:cysteine-S-conjugate beta-lyase n=1 Tax=Streptomyces polyasparticus TaxID=2767826 RepID=A0ABR7SIX2_9ACTN|nr:aminotransferase class I/II-fold pyridoxal phosphate-dependent enzyme [Streptomyces polyasparticus]MBC9714537.1 aminotransferase class I/II-fold pyridoxal phosphate-dependent enzyme [Streptomyces polyasparticus]
MTSHDAQAYDFDRVVDRRGTWCTQWDYVEDRFGVADLLPFTISDMDFEAPPEVLAALRGRLEHGVLGYSRWRHEDFLSAVVDWFGKRYATEVDPASIAYAPAVLYQAGALIDLWSAPGDGVVVHTPAYDAFPRLIAAHGREMRGCGLDDWAEFERLLALPDTSVLLLCSPHNPTGRVWTEDELERMAALCARHDVAVISDEIHADLAHRPHTPWARVGSGRWAVVTSASKSFNIPALTGSYAIIGDPASHAAYLRRLKDADGLSSPAVLSLVGHIAAYREGGAWLDALRAYVAGNLELVAERLAGTGLDWQPPQAGYLAWIDLRPLGIHEDEPLQRELIEREKAAIMPGGSYGAPGFVRLNVGCPRAKAEAGVDALVRAVARL